MHRFIVAILLLAAPHGAFASFPMVRVVRRTRLFHQLGLKWDNIGSGVH